jgi:hypothetical protein
MSGPCGSPIILHWLYPGLLMLATANTDHFQPFLEIRSFHRRGIGGFLGNVLRLPIPGGLRQTSRAIGDHAVLYPPDDSMAVQCQAYSGVAWRTFHGTSFSSGRRFDGFVAGSSGFCLRVFNFLVFFRGAVGSNSTWRMGRLGHMELSSALPLQGRGSVERCFLPSLGLVAPGLSFVTSGKCCPLVGLCRERKSGSASVLGANLHVCHSRVNCLFTFCPS